jgi:carboxylesterase type B
MVEGGYKVEAVSRFHHPGYPTLNVSSLNDFVLVYSNNRLNAFGFLPGSRIKNAHNAVLNPGILDLEYALQWIQRHISKFIVLLSLS